MFTPSAVSEAARTAALESWQTGSADTTQMLLSVRAALTAASERWSAMPCGSCHPCVNYADETWRAADRKPPHVYEWDEAKAALDRTRDLLTEWESDKGVFNPDARYTLGVCIDELKRALAPPSLPEACALCGIELAQPISHVLAVDGESRPVCWRCDQMEGDG